MVNFPFVVDCGVGEDEYLRWKKYYSRSLEGHKCFCEEGLWRRTQDYSDRELSGWSSSFFD